MTNWSLNEVKKAGKVISNQNIQSCWFPIENAEAFVFILTNTPVIRTKKKVALKFKGALLVGEKWEKFLTFLFCF